jgi:hypothetical protein
MDIKDRYWSLLLIALAGIFTVTAAILGSNAMMWNKLANIQSDVAVMNEKIERINDVGALASID